MIGWGFLVLFLVCAVGLVWLMVSDWGAGARKEKGPLRAPILYPSPGSSLPESGSVSSDTQMGQALRP